MAREGERYPYRRTPDQTLSAAGHGTGLVVADIGGSGWPDVVVAGGNLEHREPVALFANPRRGAPPCFAAAPSLWSAPAHHGGLAAGDVDCDGRLELVAAVIRDPGGGFGTGGVEVLRAEGGGLVPCGARLAVPNAADCALGDLDGDGWLDLAVAVFGGRQRVYLNRRPPCGEGAAFADPPDWQSDEPLDAACVLVGDVDGDGRMDVVFGASRTSIFFGQPPATGAPGRHAPLAGRPGWRSADRHAVSYGVDLCRAEDGGALLAATSGCWDRDGGSGVALYRPGEDDAPRQRLPGGDAARVLFADLDGDGRPDLVFTDKGEGERGAPVRIHPGTASGVAAEPGFVSATRSVGQGIAVADLARAGVEERRETFVLAAGRPVVTLGCRRVEAIVEVCLDGAPLRPPAFAWAPGGPFLSVAGAGDGAFLAREARGPSAGSGGARLAVRYLASRRLDLIVAAADPTVGVHLFHNAGNPRNP